MLAHGLRDDIADLDVLARGRAWQQALAHDDYTLSLGPHSDELMLNFFGGDIEISEHWVDRSWDVDQLIDTADIIDFDTADGSVGLRFAELSTVWGYKRGLNRPKDQPDLLAMKPLLRRRHPAAFVAPPVTD